MRPALPLYGPGPRPAARHGMCYPLPVGARAVLRLGFNPAPQLSSRTAAEAGLIKSEIHRLTGIARSTLDRILGTGAGGRP